MSRRARLAISPAPGGQMGAWTRHLRRAPASILAAWLICMLAGCGGEPGSAPADTPASLATAETSQASGLPASPVIRQPAIGEIVWTTGTDPESGAPASPVPHVAADASRIVAAVQASDLPAGSNVQASWAYNNTPLEAFTTTVPIDRQINQMWISFQIERSADVSWPAGLYEITIQLDGEVVQEASIEVWEAV